MKKILDSTFQSVDTYIKHGPDIISRLSVHKNKTRIKEAIDVCKDYLTNFMDPAIYKICAVKFLKDLFDEALFYVIEQVEQSILPIFHEVILYREEVKQFNRGNTFLLSKEKESLKGKDIIEIMSQFVTPSKTYFQLVHQCVFYWARYIEEQKSPYKTVYESVKHCTFPQTFKHFKENDDLTFKQRYKFQQNAVEYELADCFKKWQQTKDKLFEMQRKDYVRQNLEGIYNWIQQFVTEYTNLLVDLKTSHYYQRKGFKQKMLSLLVQKKQFLKLYIECMNKNSFKPLYLKYGRQEEIDEQFGIKKSKRRRKKNNVEYQDIKLTDIKRIYLADYPQVLSRYEAMPVTLERSKYYAQYKKGDIDSPSRNSKVKGIQRSDSKNQISNNSKLIKSPSEKLKSSFASNGKSIVNINSPIPKSPIANSQTPFIILPLESSDNKKLKLNTEVSKQSLANNNHRSSLNNETYRAELLSQRKVNASVNQLSKNQIEPQKVAGKSKQKKYRLYKLGNS